MRQGVTLIELVIVLVLIAALCAIGVPRLLRHLDRTHVRHATSEIMTTLALARSTAVAQQRPVSTHFDSSRASVAVLLEGDTLAIRALGAIHGVSLRSNRDSTTYGPTGLGYGAANQTVVVRRGRVADSVVISRLGRVRR